MSQHNILIADSGSTKTDWCLLTQGKKKNLQTQGINPYFHQENEILHIFRNELKIRPEKQNIDEIHFYGAGIGSNDNKKRIEKSLRSYFGIKKVAVHSDMLAAARASCQHEKGIACILGTGSNTAFFDGKKIGFKTPTLGYVLGDEGGGTHLGKKILQYALHGIFDKDLQEKFSEMFDTDKDLILDNLYRKPLPNRYLAGFARFVFAHRGHYMIENIAEDCLNDLFIHHLLRYPQAHKVPVHFTGSVAFYLSDILENLCSQYDMRFGSVMQKPMKGLIAWHSN